MQNFDEIGGFLHIDPEMLMILIILYSRASCCTSVLKIQGPPMLSILLVMEEEDKAFYLGHPSIFLVVRVFILPARHFKRTFYPQGDGWE
jgi:hypothetical protein